MNIYLSGQVFWSYDHEIEQTGLGQEIKALFSFTPPIHHHSGIISLTEHQLVIEGDLNLPIPLSDITQIYLGFDEIFKRTYVKNGGMFWQPLRLIYNSGFRSATIYLIIDHNAFGAKNTLWFNTLKQLLSE
ncbi:hypothetical protein [Mucilaginibacter sp.]|uniref:hypothetical protein n=1 Tax=Mucilaginibacter sp. TaxID=1882438 RepID=UPI002ED26B83